MSADITAFTFENEEELKLDENVYTDEKGVLRYVRCKLVSPAHPVSCQRCLLNRRHGRGRIGVGCCLRRCPGHLPEALGEVSMEEEPEGTATHTGSERPAGRSTGRTMATPPGSPRRRITVDNA